MLKLALKTCLYAVAFALLMPLLGIGVTVHGDFLAALGVGLGFALVSWLAGKGIQLITAFTLGLAGCLYLFVWWLVPALCLHFTALLLPEYLTVDGVGAAIFGGLVLMVMSVMAALFVPTRTED